MVRYKLAPVLRPPRPFHPPPPPVHRPPLMQFVCSFLLVQRVVVTSRPSRPQYQKSSVHTTCHVKKKEDVQHMEPHVHVHCHIDTQTQSQMNINHHRSPKTYHRPPHHRHHQHILQQPHTHTHTHTHISHPSTFPETQRTHLINIHVLRPPHDSEKRQ